MKRTTVMIPDDLKIRAANRAQSEGISLGEFIRTSLEKALRDASREYPDDPFLADGCVYEEDTPSDLAQNHDKYLSEWQFVNSSKITTVKVR
jgi:hypothetical protein